MPDFEDIIEVMLWIVSILLIAYMLLAGYGMFTGVVDPATVRIF